MKKVKLGEILDVTRGASLAGKYYSNNGVYIRLTLGNFDYPNGGFKENTSKDDVYYTGSFDKNFLLKKGDIITPLTEQVSGLLGETAKIPEDDKYIQSGDIGLIKPNEEIVDKNYLYYLISSSMIKKQLDAAAQQTKIRHTSPDKIKDCIAWIPKLKEQKKISNLLDKINSMIKLNENMILQLNKTLESIYNSWFIQYNIPTNKYSASDMIYNNDIKKEIPKEWAVENLYYIADFINGLACQKHRPKNDEYLPVIKIREMHSGIDDKTEKVKKDIDSKYIINDEDILFSWSATLEVMKWYGGKAGLNQHIFKVVPKYGSTFVFMTLSNYINNFIKIALSRKTTMGHITTEHIKQSKIVVPPKEIIDSFELKVNKINKLILNAQKENLELNNLKRKITTLLINGQLKII